MERESIRKENSGRTKLRRVRKEKLVNMSSSSSQRAVSEKYEQPSVMGGCNNYSSKKTRKEDEEMDLGTKEVEGKGDFQGTFTRDPDSKFRKIVQRVKSTQSDPIMKGRIMARTGGRRIKFCADTGCSVNIMPAKLAAAGGLKWGELDWDESTYKSVTNEDLTIIGQTKAFIKLDLVKTPIMLEFLVCTDDGDVVHL